jgi:3'-phosphoadenosine 5'-phosphosulfate sulfotransferase (PAPS reductase)/FAD synthetase
MTYFDNRGPVEDDCPQCGDHFKNLYLHWSLSSECENPNQLPYDSFALFSGGHDSLVATHYCMKNDLAECVIHLDTNTGIDANEEFVRETCAKHDWPLEVYRARMTLAEFAKEWGFPKAGSHSWAYRYFKERPLARVSRDAVADTPKFYTGVRKDESTRRMENIEPEQECKGWIWMAPIADWTKDECEQYIDEHDLRRNPVVSDIHRSGECYCGAYASRDIELIDLQANYEDHAEWLLEVEETVQEEIGREEDYCWWGTSGVSSERLQELVNTDDREDVPMMCQDCAFGPDTNHDHEEVE